MAKDIDIKQGIDWTTIWIYVALVIIGVMNIYAAVYNVDNPEPLFSLSNNAGKQIMFMFVAFILIMIILFVDFKVYDTFAYIFYGVWILVLIATIFLGSNINGSKSWIKFGSFSLQPAEFAKTFTVMAIAKYMSTQGVNVSKLNYALKAGLFIIVPPLIIILQKETGSALTFAALFIVLYREGLPGIYPALVLTFIVLFILALVFPNWAVVMGLALIGILFFYLIFTLLFSIYFWVTNSLRVL
jgi:rod shape determining protein RodA